MNLLDVFSLPMSAGVGDRVVGMSEFGTPAYRTPTGTGYYMRPAPYEAPAEDESPAAQAYGERRRSARHGPQGGRNDGPGLTGVLADIASEAWQGITAPGRALAGEPVTLGDAWRTALDYGGASNLVPAPAGALRSGNVRSMTPAQEVATMLREGRGAEVTDALYSQADPQELGALYASGETGMDFPMDTSSRMARAEGLGFNENALHGTVTSREFQGFKGLDRRGNPQETYFAPDSDDGRRFVAGFSSGDQGRVFPVMLRTQDVLDTRLPDDLAEFRATLDRENRLFDFEMKGGLKSSGLPGWGDQGVIDAIGQSGRDGLRLHERDWVESVAMHNPNAVRSRFARFDPRLTHLRNLSAAAVPLTFLAQPEGATFGP